MGTDSRNPCSRCSGCSSEELHHDVLAALIQRAGILDRDGARLGIGQSEGECASIAKV